MTTFLSFLINGLSLGSLYALIALGFVIIYKASEILNFAHGAFLLLGAYVIARLEPSVGFFAAVAIGIVATALVAFVSERVLFSRVRSAHMASLTIMTLGLDLIITTDLTRRIGSSVLSLGQPWGAGVVRVGGVSISENRLIAIVVAFVLIGLLFAAFRFTSWGVALRAAAEDGEAAALMGIRQARVGAVAWIIAGGLAAVAAVFLTGSPTPGLEPNLRTIAFAAFPAAILGGLDSTTGALAGGLIVGVAESLFAGYNASLTFLGGGFSVVVPYAVMMLVLVARPAGLFGTKELHRV
ncbi:branched-chain amino acid ABC transporter permease [Parafrankia soli]|uniref:Branched-chain amino acid ABC transporter permease n=1 Tax=Parafrankia soli TaxID=2599596 RepID=A0A1S1PSL6_9ACTN|nr:branched-chain amino acid ABC transporter permease [Parafrankia soli]OHV22964.1 branched-chain amino acid ABC transporter permease [Parafrankia soli]CAI7973789.1 branched-chain amino acid transport system permease protein [Frankia sp. Hr75.2]